MADTRLGEILEQVNGNRSSHSMQLTPDWMQGRAGYGGLVSALALKAMRGRVDVRRKVRSLLVSFVGPVGPGDFTIEANRLRAGKSVTQVEARVMQKERVCSTLTASFGEDRESVVQIDHDSPPPMTAVNQAMALPYIDGLTPNFTRHFTYRWALGEMPFSGKGDGEIGGWIRFRETSDCLSEEWLVALADAWPTPVLGMLTAPTPASTVSWQLGFVHLDRQTCAQDDWWGYHAVADSAENGYVHERATIWDPAGQLALHSLQTTVVFG